MQKYRLLLNLGVPPGNLGIKFTISALEFMEEKEYHGNIIKGLYTDIAEKHNTTVSKVERAIRHVSTSVLTKGNSELVDEVFSYSVCPEKGTISNTSFLHGILYYLEYEKLPETTETRLLKKIERLTRRVKVLEDKIK